MKILRVLAGTAFVSGIVATGSIEAKDGGDDCANGKEALSGFYVSAGGGYSSQKTTVDIEEGVAHLVPGVLGGMAGVKALYDGSGCSITESADGGFVVRKRIEPVQGARRKTNDIKGAIALGSGRFVGEFYIGMEVGLEIGKSGDNKTEMTFVPDFDGPVDTELACYKLKNSGFVPSLRLRLGGFSRSLNGMFYTLIGVNRVKATLTGDQKYAGSGFSLVKLTPSIGFGFEKNINKKMSIKFEGDYKIKSYKNGEVSYLTGEGCEGYVLRVKTAGFAVRALVNWRI